MRWLTARTAARLAAAGICTLMGAAVWAGVFYPQGATTLHFAFEGSPNGDRPVVRPPAIYASETGFGFVNSPELIGNANGVQAPRYFRFDADVPAGNYDVSVRVGCPLAGNMAIRAEGHRAMAYNIVTQPRGNAVVNFTVHVDAIARGGELGLDFDNLLTLECSGENPSMMKLDIKPNTTATTVYLQGDSPAAADRDDVPRVGWGQMLPLFFRPGEVAVANEAGAAAGRDVPREGDVVLLVGPMGKEKTAAEAALRGALANARQKKWTPVVVTPAPRRPFDAAGRAVEAADASDAWAREVAEAEKVPFVDLRSVAAKWLVGLGPEGSKAAFAYYPANAFAGQAAALADDESYSAYGAFEVARLLAVGLRDAKAPVAEHLYADIPGKAMDVKEFPAGLGYDYLRKR